MEARHEVPVLKLSPDLAAIYPRDLRGLHWLGWATAERNGFLVEGETTYQLRLSITSRLLAHFPIRRGSRTLEDCSDERDGIECRLSCSPSDQMLVLVRPLASPAQVLGHGL